MKIFVIVYSHFSHETMIKYCDRPFKNVHEVNKVIIKNWNEVVEKDDIAYCLGNSDFWIKKKLQEIFFRLNGKKYLIMKTHALRVGKTIIWL